MKRWLMDLNFEEDIRSFVSTCDTVVCRSPLSLDEIARTEELLDCRLPEDYLYFSRRVFPHARSLFDILWPIPVHHGEHAALSIVSANEFLRRQRGFSKQHISFFSNGLGDEDYFDLDRLRVNEGYVWHWSHDALWGEERFCLAASFAHWLHDKIQE